MVSIINIAADYLIQSGITAGQRIAILSQNSPSYAIATLALWKLKAIVVPISTRLSLDSVNRLLLQAGCDKIIISDDYSGNDFTIPVVNINDLATCDKQRLGFPSFDQLDLDLNSDASILFTSASSGNPKAVLHTIGNHYYSAIGSNENIPFTDDDCWLMSLPMYHISGFSLITRTLVGNANIYFTDEPLHDAITQPEITHVSLVPTQLQRLIAQQSRDCKGADIKCLPHLKAILLGGAAIPPSLIDQSEELGLPVYLTYGSTELASQIATSPVSCRPPKVLTHRELTISEDGEIKVKGKTLFKGYVKSNSIERPLDTNGYFATGDIGQLNQQGDLSITGRKDLMFISGGENIYPEQIEQALFDLDNIEQAVVVPLNDVEFGQRPVAFIQTTDDEILDVDEVTNALKQKIESFKVPTAFYPMPTEQSEILKPSRKKLSVLANQYHSKTL